jgi:hypothetical protein
MIQFLKSDRDLDSETSKRRIQFRKAHFRSTKHGWYTVQNTNGHNDSKADLWRIFGTSNMRSCSHENCCTKPPLVFQRSAMFPNSVPTIWLYVISELCSRIRIYNAFCRVRWKVLIIRPRVPCTRPKLFLNSVSRIWFYNAFCRGR